MVQRVFGPQLPSSIHERRHGTLILFAALFCCVMVNMLLGPVLPRIETFALMLHITGFSAILIPLVVMALEGSTSSVLPQLIDVVGWDSNGLAWFIGLISSNLGFVSYDGPCHFAEEVRNASTVISWAMTSSSLLNGAQGFPICIALSFTLGTQG